MSLTFAPPKPSITAGKGLLANRPASGSATGQLYYVTDAGLQRWTRWNGTAWEDIPENVTQLLGLPVPVAQGGTGLVNLGLGNLSRLTFVSTTQIQLGLGYIPLKVGATWTLRPITAVVTVANTGLTANTTYFVYAFDNAGVTTLDPPSLTGHSTDTTFGIETKTGDATRTLVGMIRTQGATPGQFVDSPSQRFTISYFNRRRLGGVNFFTVNRTTTSATYVELNAEIRCEFVTWADEAVLGIISGGGINSASAGLKTSMGFDGATAEETWSPNQGVASATVSVTLGLVKNGLAEGYHFATLLGLNAAGDASTVTWVGGATVGQRTALSIGIQG